MGLCVVFASKEMVKMKVMSVLKGDWALTSSNANATVGGGDGGDKCKFDKNRCLELGRKF